MTWVVGSVVRRGGSWQRCCSRTRRSVASLAYEKIGRDGEDTERVRTAIVIHGLMGAGKNLKTLGKQLLSTITERSPPNSEVWQFVLVDLRNHGNSAALEHLRPPHNIRSAAKDIADLVKSEAWKWPDVVMGHSLGGKVALHFAESCANGEYGPSAVLPKQLWVLDAVPGKIDIQQSGEVERVLKTIEGLPDPVPSRRWLLERLEEEGFSKSLGQWLGSNLKRIDPSSEQMTWIFNIKGIYDMYLSYKQTNYWPFLESLPKGIKVGIVRAEKSDRWFPEVLLHLEKVVEASKQQRPNHGTVSCHVLEKAGHWLHVDNPSGLVDILAPSFVELNS